MPGVICDQRTAARVKAKVYKLAGRPATMCGLETVALTFLEKCMCSNANVMQINKTDHLIQLYDLVAQVEPGEKVKVKMSSLKSNCLK